MCDISDAYLDAYLDANLGPDVCLLADTDICRHCHPDAERPANAVCAVHPVRDDSHADAKRFAHAHAHARSVWARAWGWLRKVCAVARGVK